MKGTDNVHKKRSKKSTRMINKRKKEMSPKSKTFRKKPRVSEDEVLEDSIRKGEGVIDSVKEVLRSLKQKEKEVVDGQLGNCKGEDKNKEGDWCYEDELSNFSKDKLRVIVRDISSMISGNLYLKYETAEIGIGSDWVCPENCCPILADVRTFDFKALGKFIHNMIGRKFDIIMMDPPWKFTTANPTRGVCISYSCLTDDEILSLPIEELQTDGFLFIWVINSKLQLSMKMFDKWGYKVVDSVDWVKMTVNNLIASGHGYYLQHAFETCLVGLKGKTPPGFDVDHKAPSTISSKRRGQSQKPEEIYEICEEMVKDGLYLEIFGRRNNCRNGWMTIGNEI